MEIRAQELNKTPNMTVVLMRRNVQSISVKIQSKKIVRDFTIATLRRLSISSHET